MLRGPAGEVGKLSSEGYSVGTSPPRRNLETIIIKSTKDGRAFFGGGRGGEK